MKTAIKKPENRRNPYTTIIATVQAPTDLAFKYIAPIYLPHIFPGTGPIAGIAGTSVNAGWNKAGLSRTIYFKDGTTTRETMLELDAPTHFAYKNEEFPSPALKYTTIRVAGEWFFTKIDDNTTMIGWTYRAIPKNFLARLFIRYVLMRFITRMLQQAMDRQNTILIPEILREHLSRRLLLNRSIMNDSQSPFFILQQRKFLLSEYLFF